jgi:hypothetical protein
MDINSFVVGFTKGKQKRPGYFEAEENDAGGLTYSIDAKKAAPVEKDVNFYDYDGTLLHSYTVKQAQELTELPEPPTHKGLTFQEWNWTLDEIIEYNGAVNVGATYITDDGKTRLYIELEHDEQRTVSIMVHAIGNSTLNVSWGDGTDEEEVQIAENLMDRRPYAKVSHTYESLGSYVIEMSSKNSIGLGCSNSYSVLGTTGTDRIMWLYTDILKKAELGSNVNQICTHAFENCRKLKSITIPNNAATMDFSGSYFYSFQLSGLECVVLPRKAYLNRNQMFSYCRELRIASLAGDMYNRLGNGFFKSCKSLEMLTFPPNVTGLEKEALDGASITKLVFHPKMTYFDTSALSSNAKLREVVIKGSPTTWNATFYGCTALESISLPSSLETLPAQSFQNCTLLKSIQLPEALISIGNNAFYGCENLESIVIPDGVQSIGNNAFYYCYCLNSIVIPDSVQSIGTQAFYSCSYLLEVRLPDSLDTIPSKLFYGCYNLHTVELPSGITSIADYAFYNCAKLREVELPSGVTSIGPYAFNLCSSLVSVNIPDGVTTIGANAFKSCRSLVSITIPNGVTKLDYDLFYNCTALTAVEVPASVTSISSGAFYSCQSLEYIDFSRHESVPTLSSYSTFNGTPTNMEIRVPAALYDAWKAATNWSNSTIVSKIVAV